MLPMDYDRNARAPDSAWIILIIGVLLAALMLSFAPPVRAQSLANLAWECIDQSAAGTWVTGNTCSQSEWRWDYGDSGHLVAGCAGTCSSWSQAIWVPWSSNPANVFACPGPTAPRAWTAACASERFLPRAQIAVQAVPPPPPPTTCPQPAPPADFQTVQCVAPQMGSWVQTRDHTCPTPPTWTPGEWTPATPPAGACVDPPPPPPPVPVPTGNLTATPDTLTFGETFTLAWAFQNSPLCEGNWAPGVALTSPGSIVLAPSASTRYGMGCNSLPGAPSGSLFQVDVTVNPLPVPWTPPPHPTCWPVNFSLLSVIRTIPSGDLSSLFSAFGLQELVSTDGLTSAFGWACDLPAGYGYAWFVMRHNSQDQSCWRQIEFRSALTPQFFGAVWDVCSRELTAAEQTLGTDLSGAYAARFAVANITAGTRPVFLRSASGGVGPRVVIGGVNQSIAVGQACDGRRRLSGTTTRYHEVSGLASLTGQTLPADSFAVCTKTDAPATGWPQP